MLASNPFDKLMLLFPVDLCYLVVWRPFSYLNLILSVIQLIGVLSFTVPPYKRSGLMLLRNIIIMCGKQSDFSLRNLTDWLFGQWYRLEGC